jgi:DNA-binding MarR family transcriptional regulator
MDADDPLDAPVAGPSLDPACPGSGQAFEQELGWGLGVASTEFRRWATEAVAGVTGGLRGYLVLVAIAKGCPPSQLALAQRLGFDKSAMTALLDGLEQAHLLDRRPDPADRRARQLVITPSGIEALSQARLQLDVAEQRFLSPLGGSEAPAFRNMLAKVAHSARQGAVFNEPCDDGSA